MLQRFLLLWLVLLSVVAFFWPQLVPLVGGSPHGWDPFVATVTTTVGITDGPAAAWLSTSLLNCLFGATMLAIGSMLPADEVQGVVRAWPCVLGGTALQYVSMPILAYALARAFGLEGAWLIGVVMAGCVPGAMASNVLTLMARGNVSYSVSLTTSATLLSPLCVPLAMRLTLSEVVDFPAAAVSWQLTWMVVVPVLAGFCLSRMSAGWRRVAARYGATIANLTILWIIAVVVGANRTRLAQLDLVLPVVLLLLNVLGYLAGWLGGGLLRLSPGMRRALTLEIGTQNAGLGTTLALGLFDDPLVAVPAAFYTFACMATGTLLARVWAVWAQVPPTDIRPADASG